MSRKTKNVKSKDHKRLPRSLKTIQANAAGIDFGSREHWVCGSPREDGTPKVERFGTTTPELFRLADWLKEQGRGVKKIDPNHGFPPVLDVG